MGKLTVNISDELERRLRIYIAREYAGQKLYGKISKIVEEALEIWMKKNAKI